MTHGKTLLQVSLMMLPNVSPAKERAYWKEGVTSIDELISLSGEQLTLWADSATMTVREYVSHPELYSTEIIQILEDKTGKKDLYRMAFSIPQDVLFLDIETTGLSQYYHYITLIGWMINGKYSYWIPGMDSKPFLEVVEKAKLLITFNGTRFDCKFINLFFPEMNITEKPNLDLLHFCRRFGLTGGQKLIEKELGFTRPEELHDCDGKEAIALWYKFLFGGNDSLDKLIQYNAYDIYGMAYILDEILLNYIVGKEIPNDVSISRFEPKEKFVTSKLSQVEKEKIREAINMRNFDISKLSDSPNYRIVGIDLAGVTKKTSRTGLCLLNDNHAMTRVAILNSEIFDYIIECKPDLVSIDAPLSLPNGRNTVYDDDPARNEAGIMRYCERVLFNRGVHSYPALIKSMQELTKRGIELSSKLRNMGFPVIECFPGAAQDILQLPRKRTDQSLLKTGLERLGINGEYTTAEVCHDELDAITAAIVGMFFIDGFYEPIGVPEENDMIVPSRSARPSTYDVVIGFAGQISSGKTTAARYIQNMGFVYCRYSQVIARLLEKQDVSVNRCSLQDRGAEIYSTESQYELNMLLKSSLPSEKRIVIDGMRHLEDYTFWKETAFKHFYLIYIDCPEAECARRYGDQYRDAIGHISERDIPKLREKADFIISNDGSLESFYSSLLRIVEEIDSRRK